MRQLTLRVALLSSVLVAGGAAMGGQAGPRRLTFEERVRAQEAIERIYYSHQDSVTRPFEQAVPREVLERKVRTYLKQSVALERIWGTPVTAEALSRELERIARETRYPERVHEIYAALRFDSFLVHETFARAILADRLARSFFAGDDRIHAAARAEAEALRADLLAGAIDPREPHPRRTEDRIVEASELRAIGPATVLRDPEPLMCRPREVSADEARVGPIQEEHEAFVIGAVQGGEEGGASPVTYAVPKTRWDGWWREVEPTLREARLRPVASAKDPLPTPGAMQAGSESSPTAVVGAGPAAGACVAGDTWDNGILDDPPDPRADHRAVWTGREMIVWGADGGGNRYDPLTDTWWSVSNRGAPRAGEAVWTGREMIVWNGVDMTGGRYDPETDTWAPISSTLAPGAGYSVWTGKEMIVWGNGVGGRYDPDTDAWRPISIAAFLPQIHPDDETMAWTGRELIVWSSRHALGGRYDPAADAWSPISSAGAPPPGDGFRAVWTGSLLVVMGGWRSDWDLGYGGRYDPATDTWMPMSGVIRAEGFSAVWTGKEIILWGGVRECNTPMGSLGRYDPVTDTWRGITTVNGPRPRSGHTAVWTGREMIVWGGGVLRNELIYSTGGRYSPESDTWTPTSTMSAGLSGEGNTGALWTGSFMLLWSGGKGALYDPVADAWRSVSTAGAPEVIYRTMWTGNEILAWGRVWHAGQGWVARLGRYEPLTDAWREISTVGAPSWCSVCVWTGREALVWGYGEANTVMGALYDPMANVWRPMSAAGAPAGPPVEALWAGGELFVFEDVRSGHHARYDPDTDTWTQLAAEGAPRDFWSVRAVWTGSQVVVLGSRTVCDPFCGRRIEAFRYDPGADAWSPASISGIPSAGWPDPAFTAVWTGRDVIVWTGQRGGRYDPGTDVWTPISTAGAPSRRLGHIAGWTDRAMIIWGGNGTYRDEEDEAVLASGGRYFPDPPPDEDLDGFTPCTGDCDESSPSIGPSAVELPGNLVDENCDGTLACSPCSPWRTHGEYVSCVARSVRALQAGGRLTTEEGTRLVSEAARSATGRKGSPQPGCAP